MKDNDYFFDYNNINDAQSGITYHSAEMSPLPEVPDDIAEPSNYELSEGHDDNVILADLANMENEIGLENLAEDDKEPILKKELNDQMKELLEKNVKIRKDRH